MTDRIPSETLANLLTLADAATPGHGSWTYGDSASIAGGSLYDDEVMIANVQWDNDPVDPRIRRTRTVEEADAVGEFIAAADPVMVRALVKGYQAIERVEALVVRLEEAASDRLVTIDGEWGCCHDLEAILSGKCSTFDAAEMAVVLDARAWLASIRALRGESS